MKTLYIFSFALLLTKSQALAQTTHSPHELIMVQSEETTETSRESKDLEEDIVNSHVNRIALKNEVHSQYVGRAGINSSVYESYEYLRDHLSTYELFALLRHDSLAVRIYAFLAISNNEPTLKKLAWSEFKGKKQKVMFLSGCIGSYTVANEIIKTLQKP